MKQSEKLVVVARILKEKFNNLGAIELIELAQKIVDATGDNYEMPNPRQELK
jgi:hypothetical protein